MLMACASSPGPGPSAMSACDLGSVQPEWRRVETEHIVFCIPPDWTASSGQRWSGAGATVEFRLGERSPERLPFAVTAGGRAAEPPSRREHYRETVGGLPAELWIVPSGDGYVTWVEWRGARPMYLQGRAPSRAGADLQLQIYRTARPILRQEEQASAVRRLPISRSIMRRHTARAPT